MNNNFHQKKKKNSNPTELITILLSSHVQDLFAVYIFSVQFLLNLLIAPHSIFFTILQYWIVLLLLDFFGHTEIFLLVLILKSITLKNHLVFFAVLKILARNNIPRKWLVQHYRNITHYSHYFSLLPDILVDIDLYEEKVIIFYDLLELSPITSHTSS